jgi:RNA polymerase sigma-70 factor (ECF subfamily)
VPGYPRVSGCATAGSIVEPTDGRIAYLPVGGAEDARAARMFCVAGRDAAASDAMETQLLLGVVSGHPPDAIDQLYHRYAGRIYSFGVRLLGDRQLAEELVQETFVRLWRTAASFEPGRGSVTAYLLTMARRIAIDLWRRPSSRPFDPEPLDTAAPGDQADNVLTAVAVNEAMATLSPQHREVLELSYFGDLTQTSIAAILGIPLGTVKTRSYYALRALKLALQERGFNG